MKESYKARVDRISAPRALIEQTKLQMYEENARWNEEQQRKEPQGKEPQAKEAQVKEPQTKEALEETKKVISFPRRKVFLSVAACAACFFIALPAVSRLSVPAVEFYEVQEDFSLSVKGDSSTEEIQSLTAEEYAEITGISLENFIPGYSLSFSRQEAVALGDGTQENRASVLYKKGDTEMMVLISDKEFPVSLNLAQIPAQRLEGTAFYAIREAGSDNDNGSLRSYRAAWEAYGQYFYLESATASEKEIARVLKNIFAENREKGQ